MGWYHIQYIHILYMFSPNIVWVCFCSAFHILFWYMDIFKAAWKCHVTLWVNVICSHSCEVTADIVWMFVSNLLRKPHYKCQLWNAIHGFSLFKVALLLYADYCLYGCLYAERRRGIGGAISTKSDASVIRKRAESWSRSLSGLIIDPPHNLHRCDVLVKTQRGWEEEKGGKI